MSLLLGLVTGGALYNKKLAMTSATREGSRFAATLDGSGTWAADAQQRTEELAASDLSLSNVCVKLVQKTSASTFADVPGLGSGLGADCDTEATPPGNPSSANVNDCFVKAWTRRPNNKLQAMFFSIDVDLTTSSVSRYEGTAGTCN